MSQLITTIIFVVLGAAICACLEAAFFTISLSRAKLYKEQGKQGGGSLLAIKEKLHNTIIMLVILNNGITIVGSIYVGHVATVLYGDGIIGIVSGLLTATIIIFGEIVPKIIGENYSKVISLTCAPLVLLLTRIFSPISFLLGILTRGFVKKNRIISEEELKMLSKMGDEEGSIQHNEQELIQRVFTLNDLTAKNIMTPRTVVEALPANSSVHEVAVVILHKPYSRYPVFVDSIDKIVGVVQSSKLLTALAKDNDNELVSYFMTAPLFVTEKKRVDDLLGLFLSTRNHMAIVQDEFGGTVGVVTFEDVLEQLVGEIVDETDEVVDLQTLAREAHTKKNK